MIAVSNSDISRTEQAGFLLLPYHSAKQGRSEPKVVPKSILLVAIKYKGTRTILVTISGLMISLVTLPLGQFRVGLQGPDLFLNPAICVWEGIGLWPLISSPTETQKVSYHHRPSSHNSLGLLCTVGAKEISQKYVFCCMKMHIKLWQRFQKVFVKSTTNISMLQ